MSHHQKTAIVTGGSRGIGAAISERLAADGFAVTINYARSADEAAALVKSIETKGGRAIAVQADIGDGTSTRKLFDATEEAFGGIDVVVNNAGILKLSAIADSDDALFDEQVAINLKGSFLMMREAARQIRDGGRIINLSSSVIGMQLPNYGIYIATKAAIEAMTPVLAKEMRGRSVTVNAIAPGPTATKLFFDGKSPELIDRMAKSSPLERLGAPEEIAAAVAFLAGPDGGWINGQTLRANGGMI